MWILTFTFGIDKATTVSPQHTILLRTLLSSLLLKNGVHTHQFQNLNHHEMCDICMSNLNSNLQIQKSVSKISNLEVKEQ